METGSHKQVREHWAKASLKIQSLDTRNKNTHPYRRSICTAALTDNSPTEPGALKIPKQDPRPVSETGTTLRLEDSAWPHRTNRHMSKGRRTPLSLGRRNKQPALLLSYIYMQLGLGGDNAIIKS